MLIGGTAFSTAGGIKIARLLLIFEKLINNKKYISTPRLTIKIIIIISSLLQEFSNYNSIS
jgi:Trk-type K+ transport system membrane component